MWPLVHAFLSQSVVVHHDTWAVPMHVEHTCACLCTLHELYDHLVSAMCMCVQWHVSERRTAARNIWCQHLLALDSWNCVCAFMLAEC